MGYQPLHKREEGSGNITIIPLFCKSNVVNVIFTSATQVAANQDHCICANDHNTIYWHDSSSIVRASTLYTAHNEDVGGMLDYTVTMI